ncbi:hypothetical protein POM88_020999 [Heracleum sosnowskyi]|uniref:Uncharacterized protein n=1 Tax=Heracleum sosnowskyi TaxID=360622 RepID=A0AAD8IDZ4_9APIA|nr:hypothetical protein POM88_020999 [Heracleum sosnowskyi]
MAIHRDPMKEMEERFASVTIEEDEQGWLSYIGDTEAWSDIDMRWFLVGRFLTELTIDFQVMQHKIASLWRPEKGLYVKPLDGKSEKFCDKLFDTPLEQLEKPYGVWMRADSRRKTHTIGSKWLRQGGGFRHRRWWQVVEKDQAEKMEEMGVPA